MEKQVFINFFIINLFFSANVLFAQDSTRAKMNMVDLKLELINSKLELLDSKMKLWETKPQELDMQLNHLNKKIAQLDFEPQDMNNRFKEIESMIEEQKKQNDKNRATVQHDYVQQPDIDLPPPTYFKYAIGLNPVRVFEGSFELFIERTVNNKNSIELSAMATYATDNGISNVYLKNQEMSYYNSAIRDYDPYNSETLSGFGFTLKWKNYLLPEIKSDFAAPSGLYAAPMGLYRRVFSLGMDNVFNEEEGVWEDVEIKQRLNIFSGGAIIGWQLPISRVVSIDVYVGGAMRLSKYDKEDHFTRYKNWKNIDFSGVLPTAGIKIGVLK